MVRQKSNGIKFILLGMIVAFLYSALILPLSNTSVEDGQERSLALTQSGNHASHQAPISIPGEEKEEENRGEKDSKFATDIPTSTLHYSISLQIETVSFCFSCTHANLAADIPIYLLKNSFLI
jgi:hypothetical protein